ncbi:MULTISPECIES: hypothetical protein [Clostridium]|jgi:heme/copper-type cytochrome/quinol oxidase subunit 3|uniref:hypothetical protein n=1 Tax=Clostridium TaxID=1485 RepID=UPI00242CB031|nr:hypothetical protein [Clostridium tyrobutyricum]
MFSIVSDHFNKIIQAPGGVGIILVLSIILIGTVIVIVKSYKAKNFKRAIILTCLVILAFVGNKVILIITGILCIIAIILAIILH